MLCGTQLAIAQVLATGGWTIKTAGVERRNLDLRPGVAARGRRVHPLGQGEAGGREQVALFPPYHHVVVPHARWRQPLPGPDVLNGPGAAQVWRPGTPAMAAGWTDPGWTLKDGLRFRVPPWPQPQTV